MISLSQSLSLSPHLYLRFVKRDFVFPGMAKFVCRYWFLYRREQHSYS